APAAVVAQAASAGDVSRRGRDADDADAAWPLLHRRVAAAHGSGRVVRTVLLRPLGTLERAEDVRRRRRPRRPARHQRARPDRFERQPRLYPAAQRGRAPARAHPAARHPGLRPDVIVLDQLCKEFRFRRTLVTSHTSYFLTATSEGE